MAENGDGGQMVIVLILGVVMMMCLSSCCSSLLTAYANECDTGGMFSMFAGDWYWNLVPSTGILGCTGGTAVADASATVNTTEQIDENKNNQPTTTGGTSDSKCNIGTEANYDYRVREKNSNGDWECPSGWHDTKCGLVSNADGKWVDGDETGAKQCRKRKSGTTGSNSSSSNSECVTLTHKDGSKDLCFSGGANEYDHGSLKEINLNDKISSVTVPKGVTLQLWEHANYSGRNAVVVGPATNKDLGEIAYSDGSYGIKNKASTLRFWKNSSSTSNNASSTSKDASSSGVTLYRDTKYGGKSKRHGTINISNASDTGMNDVISSMKISPGYVFKGYENKNFKGKSKTWKSDTNWIGTTWNDRISSYKIYKK